MNLTCIADYFSGNRSETHGLTMTRVQRQGVVIASLAAFLLCPFTGTAQYTVAKITADDEMAFDYFGWSMAVSGDYALFGSKEDDDRGTDAGAAYIFHYDGSAWVQQAKLLAANGSERDRFGWSSALSGDYAMVGVKEDDLHGTAGSVYVFHYDGSTWTEEAVLSPDDAEEGDWFGYDVSLSGDYALVGAYLDDDRGINSGSAYIFHYDGSGWIQQTKLLASDGESGDDFGNAVFLSGDYALIGANLDDDVAIDAGAAYVLHFDGSSWVEEAKLTPSDGGPGDWFGRTVSLSGDYVIIGAPYHDGIAGDEGSAYIFHYDGSTWSEQAKLTSSDGSGFSDHFGRAVSILGTYALVGSTRDDDDGHDSGSAYLFHYDGTSWREQSKLISPDAHEMDHFGRQVILSGKYALVESWLDDEKGTDGGAVFVYTGFDSAQQVDLIAPEDGAVIASDTVTFRWHEGFPDIDHYWLEIAGDSVFASPVFLDSLLADTSETVASLEHNLEQWWRVKAHNPLGWGNFSEPRSFSILADTVASQVVLIAPADGSVVGSDSALFVWHRSIPDVDRYWLDISRDSLFGTSAFVDSLIADTTDVVTILEHDTFYWWKVRAHNSFGWGEFSVPGSFHYFLDQVPCDSIDLFQARCIPGGTIQARIVLLNSTQYTGEQIIMNIDGVNYTLTIGSNGTNSRASTKLPGQTPGIHTVSLLSPAGCFDPVIASCPGGLSKEEVTDWEDDANLVLPLTTSLSDNYPNPFNSTTTFSFSLHQASRVSLCIYNILGEQIAAILNETLPAGIHTRQWNASGLPSGIYFYRFTAGRFVETRKVLLLK